MPQKTCYNCGEILNDKFAERFYEKFRFCPKCSNPQLTPEREKETRAEMEIGEPSKGTGLPPVEKKDDEKIIEEIVEAKNKVLEDDKKTDSKKEGFLSRILK